MIANELIFVIFLLMVRNAMADVDIGNALINFKNNTVRGIYVYKANFLGVVLDNEVYVGQLQNEDLVEIARIPLNKSLVADFLLEFKLINESTALTCTSEGCSVCSPSATSSPNCYDILISARNLSATFVNNDIILRIIRGKGDASIYYFVPNYKLRIYEESGRRSLDASSLKAETVAGFSTQTHSYFIGSAMRLDLSLYLNDWQRSNNNIRITRICNGDETVLLDSRIDLLLSCEGISYEYPTETVLNRATAALYLPETSELLVAFQHGQNHNENYVCSYDFQKLEQRFSETWNKCQTTPKPELTKASCREKFDGYEKLTDDCFLFSWDNNANEPYCAAYNGAMGDDKFDNCELHMSKSTYRAYGSVENFKPYDGKLLFTEKHAQPIVALQEIQNEDAFYALRKDNWFIKVRIDDSLLVKSIPGKSGKHLLEVLPDRVLYVPPNLPTTIYYFFNANQKNTWFIWKVTIFATMLAVLFALFYAGYIYICRRNARQQNQRCVVSDSNQTPAIQLTIVSPVTDQLNASDLVVQNTQLLGEGNSAKIYKGSFKTTAGNYEPVAVKILNDSYTTILTDELKVLSRVRHANVVAYIGYTQIAGKLNIVTEYMAGGSLHDYISNTFTDLKYEHIFDYMNQILSAMVYLSGQSIVHHDLAARNCLLNADRTVLKVSDFGLARSVDSYGEYQVLHGNTALPRRWIAIEAFSTSRFTEKSDVWSFGVLVWELFTRGSKPYDLMDTPKIQEFLNSGQRLKRPETCPYEMYTVMLTCWDAEPQKRPFFKQLQKDVTQTVKNLSNVKNQLVEIEYKPLNNQLLSAEGNGVVIDDDAVSICY